MLIVHEIIAQRLNGEIQLKSVLHIVFAAALRFFICHNAFVIYGAI
jgi:hypothetical protein